MTNPSLLRSSLVYWTGRLASRSVSFLMLPIYTAFILPADWGILNIIFVTTDMIGIIAIFQLPSAMFRFWLDATTESDKRRLAGTALAAPLIASTILFLPVYLFADTSARLLGIPGHAGFIQITLLTQQIMIAVEIMQAEMRLRDQAGRYAVLEIVQNFLIAGLSIFFVAFMRLSALGVLCGQLLAFALLLAVMAPAFLRRIELRWDPRLLRTLASFVLPLIPSALAMAAIHNVDRYFIQHLLGTTEVGIYSIAHRFGTMISVLFLSPFLLVWDPKSYEIARLPDAPARFGRIVTYVVTALLFLALILISMAYEFVHILTAPAYYSAAHLIAPLSLAYVAYAMDPLLRFGLLQHRRTKTILGLVAASCLVTVAGNMILLPRFGLVGAAYTTLIAFCFLAGLDYFFARRYFRYRFEWKKLALIGVVFALILFSTHLIHQENLWISIAIKSVIIALYPAIMAATVVREETIRIFWKIRKRLPQF